MRAQGSSGGHNGLNSLIEALGPNFARLRIGIGRSRDDDAIDRVLSPFASDEWEALPAVIARAIEGIELWLTQGIVAAMNRVNAKELPPRRPKRPLRTIHGLRCVDGEQGTMTHLHGRTIVIRVDEATLGADGVTFFGDWSSSGISGCDRWSWRRPRVPRAPWSVR